MSIRRQYLGYFALAFPSLFALLAAACLGGCHRDAPLPPELAAVSCPADSAAHAWATIGKAKVLYLCIPKSSMAAPNKIGCVPAGFGPCQEVDEIQLSHRAHETLARTGSIQAADFAAGRADADREGDSQLYVIFHQGPPTTQTFSEGDTPWRFMLTDGESLLPSDFTFVKGTQCDRKATILGIGTCNMEARTASLYWHISVSISHSKDTEISPSEYRTELAFWMPYLSKMVKDDKAR